MLIQNEKKNQYEEEQQQQHQDEERVEELSKREIQILNCIKGQSRTEKENSQNGQARYSYRFSIDNRTDDERLCRDN